MRGPLSWGFKLEPSLLPLIRVISYAKILLYAIFEWKNIFQNQKIYRCSIIAYDFWI